MTLSAVTPSISENDPQLTTIQYDYSAVHFNADGSPYITDRYLNLAPAIQRYILALARIGHTDDLAQRVATCCRTGHVSKRCRHGRFAVAHRHHCGDYFCGPDSNGKYRFGKWMAKRDHSVFHIPHEGLEIKFRTHKPTLDTHIKKMNALRTAANTLISKLTKDSVSVVAFSERISDDAIRVVYPGKSYSYVALKKILDELGFDNLYAVSKRGTTEELFHWAFNGFHDLAVMDPDAKAALRVALVGQHTISTTGALYSPLSKEELAKIDASPCICPICKDHDLDVVPLNERHVQRTEDIQDAFEYVDWSREHLSPFLVRNGDLTNKSAPEYGSSLRVPTVVFASPPG